MAAAADGGEDDDNGDDDWDGESDSDSDSDSEGNGDGEGRHDGDGSKGPRTHVIVYSSFVEERVDSEKAGEYS